MIKCCELCEMPLHDGDELIVVMRSTFVHIPSTNTYAVAQPTRCLEITHAECYEEEG